MATHLQQWQTTLGGLYFEIFLSFITKMVLELWWLILASRMPKQVVWKSNQMTIGQLPSVGGMRICWKQCHAVKQIRWYFYEIWIEGWLYYKWWAALDMSLVKMGMEIEILWRNCICTIEMDSNVLFKSVICRFVGGGGLKRQGLPYQSKPALSIS